MNSVTVDQRTVDRSGRIAGLISLRTGGRIDDLRVKSVEGKVLICGHARSYYARQLALAAAQEAVSPEQMALEVCIDVCRNGAPGGN